MRAVFFESLSIRGFRNLANVDFELGAGFNVLSGDNGQGKTNLLESLYVLATSRSFRTAKPSDWIAVGGEIASLRARVREGADVREQSVGVQRGLRAVRIDGRRPQTLAAYAVRTPAVVFHPGAVALAAGAGAERRKLLDRVALYLFPASLADGERYAKSVRSRQRVLELRGDSAPDLDGWEELIVQAGAAVMQARASAANSLVPAAERAFLRIGPTGLAFGVSYEPGAPRDETAYLVALRNNRTRDRARRSASVGPHRDDLRLELGGLPVRGMASQGQQRAVVLALELAELDVISSARGVRPVLLLDDVSSELDRSRTLALLSALGEQEGQVVLTTTRPELIAKLGEPAATGPENRRDFWISGGRIEAR